MLVSEMPVAGLLYAKRLSDGKECFVVSGFCIRGEGSEGGVNVVCDGEVIPLYDGNYKLFRK